MLSEEPMLPLATEYGLVDGCSGVTCWSLDEALEFCGTDECVEVAPNVMRVRKVELSATDRKRAASRAKQLNK